MILRAYRDQRPSGCGPPLSHPSPWSPFILSQKHPEISPPHNCVGSGDSVGRLQYTIHENDIPRLDLYKNPAPRLSGITP